MRAEGGVCVFIVACWVYILAHELYRLYRTTYVDIGVISFRH